MSGHNAAKDLVNAGYDIDSPIHNGTIASPAIQGGVVSLVTGATQQDVSLAAPERAGLEIVICLQTDGGGNAVVTAASAVNASGNTVMTFDNAGDTISLKAVRVGSSVAYRVVGNDGVALS